MMWTLLLRLAGPMQSWGSTSRFTERDTELEPSKSGVIGLLCAALGKPRLETPEQTSQWPALDQLTALRMGVWIEVPGKVGVDFQTAGGGKLGSRPYGVAKANSSRPESVMSWRYYLQDAIFLVGLESSDHELLQRLQTALQDPVWPLYLGRKSYVPSHPVYVREGVRSGSLEEVIAAYVHSNFSNIDDQRMRLIVDDPEAVGGEARTDLPLDFAKRRFAVRHVKYGSIPSPPAEG